MRTAALPLLLLLALSASSSFAYSLYGADVSSSLATQRHLLGDIAAAAADPSDPVAVPPQLPANVTSPSNVTTPSNGTTTGNGTSPTTTTPPLGGNSSSNGTSPVVPTVTPPITPPTPPAPTNAFRFDCELLSNPAVFPAGDIYTTALVRSFARMQRDAGRCGYTQLAGIHGSIRRYDNATSTRGGFCPHGSQNFVPWHRYYTCHMETCLIQQCLAEAQLFTNNAVRTDLLTRVCHLLRMPYWQWTVNPTVCRMATATTWPVLGYDGFTVDNIANPWLRFGTSRRTSNSMTNSCRRNMGAFIASRNRNCLFTGTRSGCTSNLEACHNNAHSSIGGTMGSVATAANDPIFFLHHTFIDLLGAQWQVNGGQMFSPGALSPFGQLYTNAVQPVCGTRRSVYYLGRANPYLNNGGWSVAPGVVASAQSTGPVAAGAEPALIDGRVVEPSAAAARTQLDNVMQSLVGDYTGYTWHLEVPEVHCKQTRTAWTIIAVLRGTRLPRSRGRAVDMAALATQPGYCDQWYAFSCVDPMVNAPYVDVTFDLTQCLAATGRQPDRAPKDPSHPLLGPGSVPVKVRDVQLVVLDANKRPMGRNFKLPGRTTLSWSYVYNSAALAQAPTTSQAGVAAAAAAAGSGGWGLVGGTVETVVASGSGNSTAAAGSP